MINLYKFTELAGLEFNMSRILSPALCLLYFYQLIRHTTYDHFGINDNEKKVRICG